MIAQDVALPDVGEFHILSTVQKKIDYKLVTSRNLRRIREAHKLSQTALAMKIGSTPGRVSAYETGADAMGTDYIERIMKTMGDVEFWQFFIDEDTPIIKDAKEKERLRLYRLEERLGIADDIVKYEIYQIEQKQNLKHSKQEKNSSSTIRRFLDTRDKLYDKENIAAETLAEYKTPKKKTMK